MKSLLPDFSPARENPAFRRLLAAGLTRYRTSAPTAALTSSANA